MVNYGFYGRNVIAREKALYKGHVIAAVAATDPSVAERALELIEVDYEVLPPVLNAEDAMKEDAPVLHERLLTMHSPTFRSGRVGRRRPRDERRQSLRVLARRRGSGIRPGRRDSRA